MGRNPLRIALLAALAATGCGLGSSQSSGSGKGVPGSTFTVQIRGDGAAWWDPVAAATSFQVTGGKLTSIPAGIDCGIVDGDRTTSCTADFPWDPAAAVTLVATMSTGSSYVAFAGSCSGDGPCVLTGNADKMVMVRFSPTSLGHPNWSAGRVHKEKFDLFVNGVPGALECTFCHGANLQGQGLAVSCNGCHATPDKNAGPTVTATASDALTGSPAVVTITAKDPNAADVIACSADLVSRPAGATATLAGGAASDCRAAAKTVSFTPDLDGVYQVRVTVSDGAATVTRNLTIGASPYGGGVVSGTSATVPAAMTQLLADLPTIPANGGAVPAVNVYRAFANISPIAPPSDGSASTQGPVLAWEDRPYDVIDVRDPASFAAGHIPGAINVPLQDLPGVLLAQPYFPSPDAASARRVLVVGYSQGDGSLGAILVTAGRFSEGPISTSPDRRAFFLAHGMATWTMDKAAAPYRWDDDLGKFRFEWTLAKNPEYVEAGGGTFTLAGKPTFEYPNIGDFNAATTAPMKRVLVRAREWAKWALADAQARGLDPSMAFVTNWGFYKSLRDAGVPHQVVSAQSDVQWNATRAIGAYRGISPLNTAHLAALDPSSPTLWHCFSNTGAVAPCFQASMLGYQTRTVLYGITGAIARDATGIQAGHNAFFQNLGDATSGGNDFPISKSASDPQDLAWTQPAVAGCRACHTDYGAQYTIAAKLPSAPAPEVQSEGEG